MGTATIALSFTLYTRSPTRSAAIGCSPDGVAMGVSGAAQIGHDPRRHCHTPPSHEMTRSQSGPQDAPGVLQGEPAWGIFVGHPAPGVAQAHSGGSIVWQMG